MDAKSKRRWYQFSLRTMLIVMVVLSAAFGYWVHWSREWIRQRRAMIDSNRASEAWPGAMQRDAPFGLWIFGERGYAVMSCKQKDEDLVTRLFPEAHISVTFDPFAMPDS
jgi:hypothetical protein